MHVKAGTHLLLQTCFVLSESHGLYTTWSPQLNWLNFDKGIEKYNKEGHIAEAATARLLGQDPDPAEDLPPAALHTEF